jgi:hypothetical protein
MKTLKITSVSNVLVRECDFDMWGGANTNPTNASLAEVSTNLYYSTWIASSGFVWFNLGGAANALEVDQDQSSAGANRAACRPPPRKHGAGCTAA